MALGIRFLTARATVYANGRSYAASGGIVTVPYPDCLAIQHDQGQAMLWIGATVDRPVNMDDTIGWPPIAMYDTTLGEPIFLVPGSNPASWVDIGGSAV